MSQEELLLWTILRNFEALALKQYELYVPQLSSPEKKALVDLLVSQTPNDDAFSGTNLSLSVNELIANASSDNEQSTLIIQGMLLEPLGQTIYQAFGQSDTVSSLTHTLCATGLMSNESINKKIPQLITEKVGNGEELFQSFMTVTRPVLRHLDTLGESIDEYFSINFADLMGDFVAELISICLELGIDRRKLMAYLTGALMGV